MFFRIKSYLLFLLKSTNQHGVHSPFVYNLVTKCLYSNTNFDKLEKSTQFRVDLLQKHAKTKRISKKRSELLIRIVTYFKPTTILEIEPSLGIGTTILKISDFKDTLPKLPKNITFDMICFDENHQKQSIIDYFEQCLNSINNDSVFIFDKIYYSKEMSEAWKYIKNHKKVTVSIDTYFWGIIFFRKEQEKEHFIIRV